MKQTMLQKFKKYELLLKNDYAIALPTTTWVGCGILQWITNFKQQ